MNKLVLVLFGWLLLIFSNTVIAANLPPGASAFVPITISNNQASATNSNFQQMIVLNVTKYASFLASNFQNVEFTYPNGTSINSWLESYNTIAAIYWLKLPVGISAANNGISSNALLYMEMFPASTNLFNGNTIGEAPELSASYAQYDDGASIFNFYDNFEGNTLGTNWVTPVGFSAATVTVNNGLILSNPPILGGSSAIATAPSIGAGSSVDMYGYMNVGGYTPEPWFGTSNPFIEGYRGYYYDLFLSGSYSSSISSATGNVILSVDMVSGGVNGYVNYATPQGFSGTITPSNILLASYDPSGTSVTAIFAQWVRARDTPPNDIMPSTGFGPVRTFQLQITPNSPILDKGVSLTLAANIVGGNAPFTYKWSINGNVVGTNSNTFIFKSNALTPSTTNVALSVTDNIGISNSGYDLITSESTPTITINANVTKIDLGQVIGFTTNIPSGLGAGPFTVNVLPTTILTSNTIPSGGGTARFAYTPKKKGTLMPFDATAVDTGTTIPYTFNSISIKLTIKAKPTLTITPNVTSVAPGNSIAFNVVEGVGGFGAFTTELLLITGTTKVVSTSNVLILKPSGSNTIVIRIPSTMRAGYYNYKGRATDLGTTVPDTFTSSTFTITVT